MNLKELARHLGLSQSTVSRALHGYQDVSPDTRERVLAAICATLPGPSPKDRQEAMALAASLARSGPPIETVGIDLLPMASAPITAAPRGMR